VSLVVLVDQATKAAVRAFAPVGTAPSTIIPGVLALCHVENTGAAFSLGLGASPLFVVLALAVLVVSMIWVFRERLPLCLVVSVAFVAGGGAGNMVDRLISGSVTDFLATTFIDFPIFNVADVCVTCGIVAACVCYMRWQSERNSVEELGAWGSSMMRGKGIREPCLS
jgi:signal peptidase II